MGKRTGPVKEGAAPAGRARRPRPAKAESEPSREGIDVTAAEISGERTGDAPSEIRESIEATRADMGETLGALQERISPSHVKEQVRESVKETIEEAGTALRAATVGKVETMLRDTGNTLSQARQSLWDTIRENPVPAALSAIGLTWLFLNRGGTGSRAHGRSGYQEGFEPDGYGRGYQQDEPGMGSRAERTVRQVKERTSGLADTAQQKAGELASTASETAERVTDRAQVQVRRVEQTVSRWMDESPLAIGVVALATGTAVGLALPRTQKEDQLLGSARDTVVDRAQELASEAVDTVRERLTDDGNQPQQQTH